MIQTPATGNLSNTERTWSVLLGASLSLLALRRGNVTIRSLEALAGTALLARAIAGHCGVKAALGGHTSLGEGLRDQWQHIWAPRDHAGAAKPGSPAHAAQSAAVDRMVEESFPASDPPGSRLPDEPPVNVEAKWQAARASQTGQASEEAHDAALRQGDASTRAREH